MGSWSGLRKGTRVVRPWWRAARRCLIVAVACTVAAGCRRYAATPGGDRPARRRIGVTLLTVQHTFYHDLRAGLQAEADDRGYDLLISTAEFDASPQSNQRDAFIVQ